MSEMEIIADEYEPLSKKPKLDQTREEIQTGDAKHEELLEKNGDNEDGKNDLQVQDIKESRTEIKENESLVEGDKSSNACDDEVLSENEREYNTNIIIDKGKDETSESYSRQILFTSFSSSTSLSFSLASSSYSPTAAPSYSSVSPLYTPTSFSYSPSSPKYSSPTSPSHSLTSPPYAPTTSPPQTPKSPLLPTPKITAIPTPEINVPKSPLLPTTAPKSPETSPATTEKCKLNPLLLQPALKHYLASNWESNSHRPYTLNLVQKGTLEYASVEQIFHRKSTSGKKIHPKTYLTIDKVQRIENPYLLAMYLMKKEKLKSQNSSVKEMSLFHGTKEENVDSICKHNFDWRRRGKSRGNKFGQGVFFSPQSFYSHHYGDVMFLVKVLVGKATDGTANTVLPPDSFDTTKNDYEGVFVKYEDDDFYPQYLIDYSIETETDSDALILSDDSDW